MYNHKEAFCLMTYRCNDCGFEERIWNSRDGVTPFGLACPQCKGHNHLHADWQNDQCNPPLEDEIADYTRIIRKKDEENEAANREIVRLEMELASVKEENDTLRRIHKENIDILVKELSDKDYEYNQKTNRLIERHAEQLNRCDAEVKRLTGRKDGEVPSY